MSLDFRNLPIFYEEFEPRNKSSFDSDLDELTKKDALAKRVFKGFCNICGEETEFHISSDNLREDVIAGCCRSINRQRLVVCGLSQVVFGYPYASLARIAADINAKGLKVYSAEANSTLFQHLKQDLNPELFFCSEYFGIEHSSGEVINATLHQDLQQTSFNDETFDLILTSEVFEHIPDAPAAEREVVRILKKNGTYSFTVPFLPYSEHDVVLAEIDDDGNIKYLADPQYHGDPLNPDEGILVYRVFSFPDLEKRFEALKCQFTTYRFWSRSLGILDNNGWVHVVRKGSPESRVGS